MQLAALGAMAFIHEHKQLAHRLGGLRLKLSDERFEVVHVATAELMHQRAHQPWQWLRQQAQQFPAALGASDWLAGLGEDAFDLLVQLVTVGNDGDAGVRFVLQNPLGQQHHHDALAAALRVPDDAALMALHVGLRRLDPDILVNPRQLLDAAVEQHEVVQQLEQPILGAHLEQVFVELESGVVGLVFLPLQEVLLLGLDGAVLQTLGVVAGKHQLHGGEEPLVELLLLI